MCSGIICGIFTVAIGSALVVVTGFVGFYLMPGIVDDNIINEVILLNDTIQLERFKAIPFPLNFMVRIFNVTNPDDVLAGSVPILTEIGPYVYNLHHQRVLEDMQEDTLSYRMLLNAEFNSEASYPHTEDDLVSTVNAAYHGVLQVASSTMPGLMGVLNMALNGIFGDNNGPIIETSVRNLLFDGIFMCQNPGLLGNVACGLMREMTRDIQNIVVQDDGSITFSVFGYRDGIPGRLHEVYRGINDHADLGRVITLDGQPTLPYWVGGDNSTGEPNVCDLIKGTDSGIFAPFIDRTKSLYALNTDICRTVEMRYEQDLEFKNIPVARFTANEWFLDNDEGCYCLNVTSGVTAENGCLLRGAMELFSCVGAHMILSYPHFLYADPIYRNGVTGLNPIEEDHRNFLDLEPNTGTVVRGAKRAQFNVFMKPIDGIPATQTLRTTLTPILWIEEGIELSDEFVDTISDDLLSTLNLVNILVPVAVALSCVVLLTGITIVLCIRLKKKTTV